MAEKTVKVTFTGKPHAVTTSTDSTECIGRVEREMQGKKTVSGSITRDTMVNSIVALMVAGGQDVTKKLVEDILEAEQTATNSAFKSANAVIKDSEGAVASVSIWGNIQSFKAVDRKNGMQRDTSKLLKIGEIRKELEAQGMSADDIDVDASVVALTEEYNATATATEYNDIKITTKPLYVKDGETSFDLIINRRADASAKYEAEHGERDRKKLLDQAAKAKQKAADLEAKAAAL